MQVLAGTLVVGLGTEIGDVDDQGVTLPLSTRVPPPLADVRGQMRTVGHGDNARPTLALAGVIEHRYCSRRLHNLQEETDDAAEIGQTRRHTPLPKASVFRAVGAIEGATPGRACRRIVWGRIQSSRRGRPDLPARAGWQVVLTHLCGLQ